MAVTKIWAIKDSLQRVLDYAANPDKTEYDALAQTLHYAENDAKTKLNESAQLVTGIHCRPDHAWEDMRVVQERFGKTDGVVALHAYQSFREGEVTPEQCHEIGVALARKVWGKRFQVLVATHMNTDNLHNHFVINSVSYVDGKKYEPKDEADTQRIVEELKKEAFAVKTVKRTDKQRSPTPPFTTSTLQQEASRKLGFQTQKTMRTAQELYEGVDVQGIGTTGLITYMRTDSLRISEEARAQAATAIEDIFGKEYLPDKPRYYKTGANAQDGHEAIRPATPSITPERVKDSLTSDQYKLYNLIWKRFMASLMASCVQDTVKLEIAGANEKDAAEGKYCLFTAAGYSVRFDGFTKVYEISDDESKGSLLPEIKVGDTAKLKELIPSQHFTSPPPRFTEASLVKEFEEKGIGRPSTYSTIITTIVKRNYVKRESKQFVPTELGEATTKLLKEKFPRIVNVKFTAQMEDMLDRVDSGDIDYVSVLDDFYGEFEKSLDKAKAEMKDVKIQLEEDITDIPCEKCGRMMVIKTGRYGRFLACPGYPECKNAKPLVLETNAKCPKCGAKVIERKTKRGYTFYGCSNWPGCDFMTWDKPTDEICPQCGKSLFKKKGGVVECLNEGCGYTKKSARKGKKTDE